MSGSGRLRSNVTKVLEKWESVEQGGTPLDGTTIARHILADLRVALDSASFAVPVDRTALTLLPPPPANPTPIPDTLRDPERDHER
jgi:hypothetical protein